MKKAYKFLSVALAFVFVFSMAILPASAVTGEERAKFAFELAPVIGETDANGNKSEENGIYKLTFYYSSNYTAFGAATQFTYPSDLLTPLNPEGSNIYYDYTCDADYTDVATCYTGILLDAQKYDASGNVTTGRAAFYGAANPSAAQPTLVARWVKDGQITFLWAAGENTLTIGNAENQAIISFYFKLNAGKTAADLEGATFSFIDDDVKASTIIDGLAVPSFYKKGAKLVDLPSEYIETPAYVYHAPVAAGPVLTHAGRQVKMTVKDGAVVSGTEQMRVISSISQEDWTNYFNNDGSNIKRVGIVAYKGAGFDVGTAKAAAMGTANDAYTVQTTDYISTKTAGVYQFAARIEYQSDVFDTSYIAFVEYTDAENNTAYAFYDESYELQFKTNYTGITTYYMGQIGA